MSKAIYPIKMSPQGIYRVCERYEEAQSGETMSEKEIDNVKKINDTHFDASFVALKQTNTRIPAPAHTQLFIASKLIFYRGPKQLENETQTTQSMQTKLLKHMKSCQIQQR